MAILGGLLGGASQGVTANGGIGGAINNRRATNIKADTEARLAQTAKIKQKVDETARLSGIAADKNQSDEVRINAGNGLNKLNGSPIVFATIDELDPLGAEFKKIHNQITGLKGNYTPDSLQNINSQVQQLELKSGEINPVLKGMQEEGASDLKKDQQSAVDFVSRVNAMKLAKKPVSPQQLAEYTKINSKVNSLFGDPKEFANQVSLRTQEFQKQSAESNRSLRQGLPADLQGEVGALQDPQIAAAQKNLLGRQASSVPSSLSKTGTQLITEVRARRSGGRKLLNTKQAQLGTGVLSTVLSSLNITSGPLLLSGIEIAPKTSEARSAIKSFNQFVKQGLTINPRNPVSELRTIQGFLLNTGITDPAKNITNFINIVNRLESAVESGQDQLNNAQLSDKQREEVSASVNSSLSLLGQLPSAADIKIKSGRTLNAQDVSTMSEADIDKIDVNDFSREEQTLMRNRLVELGGS